MRRRLRLFAAAICLALWAAFTILWWRSISREDHLEVCLPLGHIEAPRRGVGPIPNAQLIIDPQLSGDSPDPRDAKRRCFFFAVNSMEGKLGVAGWSYVIQASVADFDCDLTSVSPSNINPWFAYKKALLGFVYIPNGSGGFGLAAPFWFLVSASGIATALLWGGHLLRFTTRGALVATTLLAWILGLGVIFSR